MQNLRGAGWVKAIALPHSPRTLKNLLGKGWIESRRDENGVFYRITDQGLAAKMAPVPIGAKPKRSASSGPATRGC